MNRHIVTVANQQANAARPVTPLGILAETLQRLQKLIESGASHDEQFAVEFNSAVELARGLETYVARCTSPESEDLASLAAETADEHWQGQFHSGQTQIPLEQEMLSGHVEGQFLKILVAAVKAKRVLEIGMFTGYSALAIAEGLPTDGRIVACELDEYAAQFAQRLFNRSRCGNKIEIEIGPAEQTLQKLAMEGEQFDFVFIDADKPGYQNYFRQLVERNLLVAGGLICVDNTLLQGEPYCARKPSTNGQAIAEFNQAIADDARVEQVLLPVRDGITLIRLIDTPLQSGELT